MFFLAKRTKKTLYFKTFLKIFIKYNVFLVLFAKKNRITQIHN